MFFLTLQNNGSTWLRPFRNITIWYYLLFSICCLEENNMRKNNKLVRLAANFNVYLLLSKWILLLGVSLTTLIKHMVGNPFINVHWIEKDNVATKRTRIKNKDKNSDLHVIPANCLALHHIPCTDLTPHNKIQGLFQTLIRNDAIVATLSHCSIEIFNVFLVYHTQPAFLHQAWFFVINFNSNLIESISTTFPQWFSMLWVQLRKQIK